MLRPAWGVESDSGRNNGTRDLQLTCHAGSVSELCRGYAHTALVSYFLLGPLDDSLILLQKSFSVVPM